LHLASTTSTVAPVRWAKPVWLRRQAKLPLQGGRRPTGRICVWPNVKSAIRKARSSPTQTWIACKNCWLPTIYNFTASLFCTQSPFKIILHPVSWWLSHSCHSCAAVFVVKIWAQRTSTAWNNDWHLANTTSTTAPVRIGKIRVAPKTSKTTTAWWLAWNWDNIIPLAMECQVNDEKRQIFPKTKQNWFLLGKRVATYNFAASLLCTARQSLFRTILDHGSR